MALATPERQTRRAGARAGRSGTSFLVEPAFRSAQQAAQSFLLIASATLSAADLTASFVLAIACWA
jgi:hypothetical protein